MKHFLVCSFILEDFQKFHIDVSLVSEHAHCALPASVVISNVSTGSRTILHMNRCAQVCVYLCVSLTRIYFRNVVPEQLSRSSNEWTWAVFSVRQRFYFGGQS